MKLILLIMLIVLILFSGCMVTHNHKQYACSGVFDDCKKERSYEVKEGYTGRPIGTQDIYYGGSCEDVFDCGYPLWRTVDEERGEHIRIERSCEKGRCKEIRTVVLCGPDYDGVGMKNDDYHGCTEEKPVCIYEEKYWEPIYEEYCIPRAEKRDLTSWELSMCSTENVFITAIQKFGFDKVIDNWNRLDSELSMINSNGAIFYRRIVTLDNPNYVAYFFYDKTGELLCETDDLYDNGEYVCEEKMKKWNSNYDSDAHERAPICFWRSYLTLRG
jgi:hypothetical protein